MPGFTEREETEPGTESGPPAMLISEQGLFCRLMQTDVQHPLLLSKSRNGFVKCEHSWEAECKEFWNCLHSLCDFSVDRSDSRSNLKGVLKGFVDRVVRKRKKNQLL